MEISANLLNELLALTKRDAVRLRKGFTKDSVSYAGGYPTLPKDLTWPEDGNGNECVFLAQFDLAELPCKPPAWPSAGHLFLFLNSELEDCDHTPTTAPFLYFASAGIQLEERRPSKPISAQNHFWYEGDGKHLFGRAKPASLKLDALPKYSWSFSTFEDHNLPMLTSITTGDTILLTPAEQKAVKSLENSMLDLAGAIQSIAQKNRDADQVVGDTPPFKGGFELIDPDFQLRATWWGRPYVYEKTNVPLHQIFEDWPRSAKTIFYHAKGISFVGQLSADRENAVDSHAHEFQEQATEWMEWAAQNKDAVLRTETRKEYIAWCRSVYTQCFELARPALFDAPRVTKPFVKIRRLLYNRIPLNWRKQRENIRSSHSRRINAIENMYDPMVVAGDIYVQTGTPDQLFGYGENIQDEADRHRLKTLFIQSWGFPNINFGDGNFKLWLADTNLKENAWQRVIVENAVT